MEKNISISNDSSSSIDKNNNNLPELKNALTNEQKINFTKFTQDERAKIAEIASTVTVLDSNAVTSFGVNEQRRMNSFLDELLKGIKSYEVGEAGEITLELAKQIKDMNLPKMKDEVNGSSWFANAFGNLPLLGKHLSAVRYFMDYHEEILKHLSEIENRAQREIGKLTANNIKLDQLVTHTIDNVKELEIYLAAGQSILMKARADFNIKKVSVSKSKDPLDLTQLHDIAEQINAFEARLIRMNIAYTDSIVSIPQIRLSQESGRIEIRNIMDTILFDIPRLKGAVIRVAALNQIMEASKETEARREITRQIGTIGADSLNAAYTKAKQSQGTGAEDVAYLAATADKILETINKGIQFNEENKLKRQQAEQQLMDIRAKLLEGLKSVS
ncbi:MAG: toxic anion resistance protein [Bacillota bacterium]|nr:toxic anion resistance protein [Bacillota bacterium]